MVHDNCTGLVVDLGIYSGVADEVDNPFLALTFRQAEAGGQVAREDCQLS